jgi:hypothetical protein
LAGGVNAAPADVLVYDAATACHIDGSYPLQSRRCGKLTALVVAAAFAGMIATEQPLLNDTGLVVLAASVIQEIVLALLVRPLMIAVVSVCLDAPPPRRVMLASGYSAIV